MNWLLFLALLLPTIQDPQIPPIGVIDFYGLHNVTEQQVRAALQIKEGDSLSDEPKDARRRLEALPGVAQARLEWVCCDNGKATLYVGIAEKGAPAFQLRQAPKGTVELPGDIKQAGEEFQKAQMDAVLKGKADEDDSQGHALMSDPAARAIQQRFIVFAARDLNLLRKVLRYSADAEQRALAAQVIAYTANKQAVIGNLVEAMRDPAGNVRNNAMRSLAVMAELSGKTGKPSVRIPTRPFVEMLNSIEWTDRNKSSLALVRLTEHRDPAVFTELRQQAFASLVEMARWKVSGHAYAPFFLLGRVAGFAEKEINEAWEHGNRSAFIESAAKRATAKRGRRRT
ncbi:MAG TPA: hypothetical protein PLQ88_07205 [Blastocatellia bacterium]|nr:hypothetical protein [Blastocatellia bacterium]HMY71606.1 hypothetical protein [Blastocatellia bacterium]HNG31211.1 hypothetical protein [Blastocatellia bacterium]